jgi:N-acyl-D-amino-acid deacylase
VKGGALAVVKDGHLVFARGYGWADVEGQQPVRPDSLFRWASISKTLTATAVMCLAESGKLDLDTPIFGILNQYSAYNGKIGDNRLAGITVRQVLHHTGGWDRMVSGDPVTGDRTIDAANAAHTSFPPSRDTVIRYMLAQRLDFEPGSRFAYSNFGYMLLGRVIEKVSGQAYETFVRDAVLIPTGLARIQQGGSTLAARLPGEVKYYDYPGAPLVSSYLSPAREMEPAPYGFQNFDLNDADGAWVGSVTDLLKFTAMLDGARPRAPLSHAGFASMIAQTPRSTWVDSVGWYGFGLFAVPQLGGITWSHGGSLSGTRSGFWRFANGICYGFLFNGDSKDQSSLTAYVAQSVWDSLAAVTDWPDQDLFPQFYPPGIAPSGVVSGASFQPGPLSPASLVTIIGADLGGKDAGTTVSLRSAGGVEQPMHLLYSGPGQLNGVLPADVLPGDAALIVRRQGWPDATAALPIAAVSPGLFTLNQAGLVAASLIRSRPDQQISWESIFQIDGDGNLVAKPVIFGGPEEDLFLILYCTGVRGRSTQDVIVHFGGMPVAADYAGPQLEFEGLDQINVKLPGTLAGRGDVGISVSVDGLRSNTGSLTFR